jgi:hypothetical protein
MSASIWSMWRCSTRTNPYAYSNSITDAYTDAFALAFYSVDLRRDSAFKFISTSPTSIGHIDCLAKRPMRERHHLCRLSLWQLLLRVLLLRQWCFLLWFWMP